VSLPEKLSRKSQCRTKQRASKRATNREQQAESRLLDITPCSACPIDKGGRISVRALRPDALENLLAIAINLPLEGKRMASGLTRNQMPGNRLRVRIPCPPLEVPA
jgi:hypothetical protein